MINKIIQILKEAGIEEAIPEAKLIVTTVCALSYEQILTGIELDNEAEAEIRALEIAEKRAKTGTPIQQLLGVANFMGLKFKVDKNVLIPRDETEILVRETARIVEELLLKGQEKIKILDIGTGTGIIPIVLAKKFGSKIEILGVDISTPALQNAIENAQTHLPPNLAVFRKSDLFSNIKEQSEKFDIIVSNPPYIPPKDAQTLQKEVFDFEPHGALFTSDPLGIEFYEKIVAQSLPYLTKSAHILFELGENQAQRVKEIFASHGFKNISTTKDLSGIERVICAQY